MTNQLINSSALSALPFEAAICAVALLEVRKDTLVSWWNAGDVHGAAEAYVSDYAEKNGFEISILNTEESAESTDQFCAIDVSFYVLKNGQLKDERAQCFTVWIEDMGHGPFIYGEW